MSIKNTIKNTFKALNIDVTKNMKYDRLTSIIIKTELKNTSNCLDIGCHQGEILDQILSVATNGKHYGFEPIPDLYDNLIKNYKDKATILAYALSNTDSITNFNIVKNSLAYSGLKIRKYNVKKPIIQSIKVETKKLDTILPNDYKIDFVKLDVEGAEYNVLEGGLKLLTLNKPKIVFEFGKGASEYYNTTPAMMFEMVKKIGLRVFLLESFINKNDALSLKEFERIYNEGTHHYFIASI